MRDDCRIGSAMLVIGQETSQRADGRPSSLASLLPSILLTIKSSFQSKRNTSASRHRMTQTTFSETVRHFRLHSVSQPALVYRLAGCSTLPVLSLSCVRLVRVSQSSAPLRPACLTRRLSVASVRSLRSMASVLNHLIDLGHELTAIGLGCSNIKSRPVYERPDGDGPALI